MKKQLTLFVSITLLISAFSSAIAQDTITNNAFTRWTPSGKPAPFNWEEPASWTSSNSLSEFVGAAITKTQMPGTTKSQVKINTLNVFGNAVPGILINGDFGIQFADTAKLPLLGGEPMTTVKTNAWGHYNFTSSTAGDSATVGVFFKKFNTTTQKPDIIAGGFVHLKQTTAGLHPFSINIPTQMPGTPDSVVITVISTLEYSFKQGGSLILDHITFASPLSVETPAAKATVQVYPNPSIDFINIKGDEAGMNYRIYDLTGKLMGMGKTSAVLERADVSFLQPGCYMIQFETEIPQVQRFIKE